MTKPDRAELAQSVERTTLNRVVVGSIPTFGVSLMPPPRYEASDIFAERKPDGCLHDNYIH